MLKPYGGLLFVIITMIPHTGAIEEMCDLRPLGTKTEPLPADNRFAISIVGITNGLYIPTLEYRGEYLLCFEFEYQIKNKMY